MSLPQYRKLILFTMRYTIVINLTSNFGVYDLIPSKIGFGNERGIVKSPLSYSILMFMLYSSYLLVVLRLDRLRNHAMDRIILRYIVKIIWNKIDIKLTVFQSSALGPGATPAAFSAFLSAAWARIRAATLTLESSSSGSSSRPPNTNR